MNFQGKAVLVYLEEDNIARAYFRIQPLMTQDGPVGDTKADYPDDGYLRIVPDKNEQHTFKERMRSMCGLCVMDLRFLPADANKIRTNKNYAPARGETNQYIIYSDAVRALPEDLIYQVVSEGNAAGAATPLVYIRNGANIQGPFRREDGQSAGDTVQLPPDSAEIHAVTVNGQELLFYWPKVEAPVPQGPAPEEKAEKPAETEKPDPMQNAYEQIQAMNVAPSVNANRLHDSSARTPIDFVPEQNTRPLAGTKLYQTPQKQVSPRRAHNQLMEAVENQRYAARYEAPGATLPQSAELKDVHNPADTLKHALQSMWQCQEGQQQAIDVVLAQPGMRALLSQVISRETNDLTVAAMHGQLQELEAERLMTLMQLDDVKKNLAAAREEAVGKLQAEEQKKIDALQTARQQAQEALNQLQAAMEPMERDRQALAEKIQNTESALEYAPHFVAPRAGRAVTRDEMTDRVEKCLTAAGFCVESGDALAMLTAFALAKGEWECCAETEEDAQTGMEAFAAALGVPLENTGYKSEVALLPGGNAPVLLNVRYPHSALVTSSYAQSFADRKDDYADLTVPSVPLAVAMDRLPQEMPAFPPAEKACVVREMLAHSAALSSSTQEVLLSLRQAALKAGAALPLTVMDQMARFISALQNDLKGGLAEAIDRAVCLYAVPYLLGRKADLDAVLPLLSAMPRTLKSLNA